MAEGSHERKITIAEIRKIMNEIGKMPNGISSITIIESPLLPPHVVVVGSLVYKAIKGEGE
jgi:hypothetical protein